MMMLISDLTDDQLQAAGYLIEATRDRLASTHPGVDRWDRAGIVGQLRTALAAHPLCDALVIGLAAAADLEAATPAAFTWPRYRRPSATAPTAAGRGPVCRHCTRTRYACEQAQRNTGMDRHDFEPETR